MVSNFEDDDIRKIVELLGQYFDGLYEGDTKKFEGIFHQDSHLYSSDGVQLTDWPRSVYFEMIVLAASSKSMISANELHL